MSSAQTFNIETKNNSYNYNYRENAVVSPPLTPVISGNRICTTTAQITTNDASYSKYFDLSNYDFIENEYSSTDETANVGNSDNYQFKAVKQQQKHKHVCHYSFCGWSFKRHEHLKRHMLVHTGERPHQCHFLGCGKSFSRSDNFHAHYRTHTKTKICATAHTKKKSAAVTTVSAAVTGGVTNTLDDSSGQYSFLTNQQCSNSISPNKNAASSIAATAAVVAVQQQQNQQVFYNNNHLFDTNSSTFKLYNGDTFKNYETNNYTMASPPTPTFNHSNNVKMINPSSILSSQPNTLPFNPPSIEASLYNHTSFIDPFFSSCYDNHATSPSPIYAPNNTINELDPSFQQRPKNRENLMKNNNPYNMAPIPLAIKPHTCPISQCSRKFKRLEHLKRHMRIHTLERPFQCSYHDCFKRFSRSDNLSQHLKIHWKQLKQ